MKVADLLGGDWPQRARQPVRSMKMRSKPEDDNIGNQLLLADLWTLYKNELETAKDLTGSHSFKESGQNTCTSLKKDLGATGRTGIRSHPMFGESS